MIAFWNKLITEAARQPHADAELLRRFIDHRDELAFELLLRRHAELVWKICHGILRHHADAEDAFQSTFLVFARKAKTIRNANVAGWLHRVATNAALKLKAKRVPTTDTALSLITDNGVSVNDDAAIVHEEVERLPERYRLPVLLCQLQELTHSQAAIELNWPIGTVAGRLSRAKKLLHKRLLARGVTGLSVATVSAVSPRLLQSAVLVALGQSVASTMVLTLSQGIGASMGLMKMKLTALALIVGCAVGTGTSIMMMSRADEPSKPASPQPLDAGENKALFNTEDMNYGYTAFPKLETKTYEELKQKCPLIFNTWRKPASRDEYSPGTYGLPIYEKDTPITILKKLQLSITILELDPTLHNVMREGTRFDINNLGEIQPATDALISAVDELYHDSPEKRLDWYRERVLLLKFLEVQYRNSWDRTFKAYGVDGADVEFQRKNMMPYKPRVQAEIALIKLNEEIAGRDSLKK